MNGYKYKPSTVMFDERVKSTLMKIQNDYHNGKVTTKTDYAYNIKQAIYEFYKRMGKPTFEFIAASDVPAFPHYKAMVESAKLDMSNIVEGCEQLNEILSDMNNAMIEETSVINKNILIIDNKVQEIEKKIRTISDASSMVFSDSFEFNNLDERYNTDTDELDDKLSHADISERVCCLATKNRSYENDFDITVLNSSNGFPGNTHEVYETMEGIKYIGETDTRMSLHSMLNPDNKDCFEFEMYNLDNEVRMKTSSIGFRYKEGISWITEDDELRLDLKITFRLPAKLNTIKLNGMPKVNFQTDHPTIKEIIIKDDYAGVQTINYGGPLLERTTINFKPQTVREIIIKLSQRDSTITKVARSYALSIDPTKIPYFFNDDFKDFTQIDKPTISIESLGLTYNTKDKSIIYPTTSNGDSFLNKEYLKSNLFYSNTNATDNDKLFTEIINAYRYRIGISYLGFENKDYAENGIYISSNFDVGEPIKKITLNAIDSVPASFYKAEDDKTMKSPFIGYYLSFNNEEEWYQIYPRTMHKSGPCSIVINSYLNVESRNQNVFYLDRLIDPTSVRLKIELRRPLSISDETPIVNEYNLDIDGDEQ